MTDQTKKRAREEIVAELEACERALKQQKLEQERLCDELAEHPASIDALLVEWGLTEEVRRALFDTHGLWQLRVEYDPCCEQEASRDGNTFTMYECEEVHFTVGMDPPSEKRRPPTHNFAYRTGEEEEWWDSVPELSGDEVWKRALALSPEQPKRALMCVAFHKYDVLRYYDEGRLYEPGAE